MALRTYGFWRGRPRLQIIVMEKQGAQNPGAAQASFTMGLAQFFCGDTDVCSGCPNLQVARIAQFSYRATADVSGAWMVASLGNHVARVGARIAVKQVIGIGALGVVTMVQHHLRRRRAVMDLPGNVGRLVTDTIEPQERVPGGLSAVPLPAPPGVVPLGHVPPESCNDGFIQHG